MSSFRDLSIVVLETSRTRVRGGLGIHELIKLPSVDIAARVGLRNSESLLNNGGCSGSSPGTTTAANPNTKVTDYLVGTQLDDAIAAGEALTVYWPFADGDVKDWIQAEALWKHVLFSKLPLRRVQNESPVMHISLPGLSRDDHERMCQIFFERFNVAALSLVERPLAQLYGANVLSGLVVEIGDDATDMTPIESGFLLSQARLSTPIGLNDCFNYLAKLLRLNPSVMEALSPDSAPLSPEDLDRTLVTLAKHIYQKDLIRVPSDGETIAEAEDEGVTNLAAVIVAGKEKAVIELGMKKKANAKASAADQARMREIEAMDLVTVTFQGREMTVGKERHRFCETLFDPELLPAEVRTGRTAQSSKKKPELLPLHDTCGQCVSRTEVDQRKYIWGGVFVTGDIVEHVKGIPAALQARVAPYILSYPDQQTEVQTRAVRTVKVPEYFAEYRDRGDAHAAFLGGSIVAKITFNDSMARDFVTKGLYSSKGPHSIVEKCAALL